MSAFHCWLDYVPRLHALSGVPLISNAHRKPEVNPHRDGLRRNSKDSGSKSRSNSGTGKGLTKRGISKKVGNNRQLSSKATAQMLLLGDVICNGCSGPVLYGTYNGQPAVVKLFGPDKDGLAAGRNEVKIYRKSRAQPHSVYELLLGAHPAWCTSCLELILSSFSMSWC